MHEEECYDEMMEREMYEEYLARDAEMASYYEMFYWYTSFGFIETLCIKEPLSKDHLREVYEI